MANGKENVKRNRLKEPDKTKYELYDILKTEVCRCGNVFTKNGYRFNGSKVDRRFSYSKIDAALQHNRYEERMGMTAKVHEAVAPNAPFDTAHDGLFNGLLGLLNGSGSSYNAADAEANQEMAEILRRKKKRKPNANRE